MATARPGVGRGHRTTVAASVAIVLSAVPPFFVAALMPIMRRDLDIGTDSLADSKKGTLWLDNTALNLSKGPAAVPTVLPCTLSHPSARPGFGTYITYRWDAKPMGRDFAVFVHFRDS